LYPVDLPAELAMLRRTLAPLEEALAHAVTADAVAMGAAVHDLEDRAAAHVDVGDTV
jgi:hypothetical protein